MKKAQFIRKVVVSLFAIAVIANQNASFAATTDFTASENITISDVIFNGSVATADLIILDGSSAESWTFDSGVFTVTNPDSTNTFKIGSTNADVRSIVVLDADSKIVECAVNSAPGTSYVTLSTVAATYTVKPSVTTNCGAQSGDSTPPTAPTDIELSINSDNQIVITWTDPTDGDLEKIEILRSTSWLPISGMVYDFVLKGVETFIDTDVSIRDEVKYILRAKDNNENASISDEYSITVSTTTSTSSSSSGSSSGGSATSTQSQTQTQLQTQDRYSAAGVTESEVDSAVNTFRDLKKDAWHAPFIARMKKMTVLSGYPDGTIQPDRTLNRAELAKIASQAFNLSTATESFSDVPASIWYSPFVGALQNIGAAWTIGSDYRPAEGVTRGEALWVLLTAAEVNLGNVSIEKLFPDVNIKHRFATAITYASQNGIVNGYENGNFEPGDTLTRGQVAKIVVEIKDL